MLLRIISGAYGSSFYQFAFLNQRLLKKRNSQPEEGGREEEVGREVGSCISFSSSEMLVSRGSTSLIYC